jgi:chromosome segregation protein
VGSNGSGKSNIVDALKWALGEQSMRDLRSRRSEDVIFSGSQTRKQASMAEVSLTFGNETGWLPIDAPEVELVRRIYRSAEAEYIINGQRVRLRDVLDVVRQGGLDSGGHLIVSQGMVDSVLSLRGIERRAYLAAVAGVAPYEARRDEALHRLAQTRQNMASAQIVYEEIEPRLRLLKRQANLADNAMAAKEELLHALRGQYQLHWTVLSAEHAAATFNLTAASKETGELRTVVEQLESVRRARQQEIETIRTDRQTRRDRFMAAEYALKRAEDARASALSTHHRLQAELEQLEQRLGSMQHKSELDTALVATAKRSDMLQARRAELQESLTKANEDLAQVTLRSRGLQEQRTGAVDDLARLRRDHDAYLARRMRLRAELDQAEESLASRREELPGFDAALAEAEAAVADLRTQADAAAAASAATRNRWDNASRQVREAHLAVDAAAQELAGLTRSAEATQRELAELRRATSRSQGLTILQDVSLDPGIALAVAAILGALVESSKAPNSEEASIRPALRPSVDWRYQVRNAISRAGIQVVGWLDDQSGLAESDSPAAALLAACLLLEQAEDIEQAWDTVAGMGSGLIDQASLQLVARTGAYRAVGRRGEPSSRERETVRRELSIQELAAALADLRTRTTAAEQRVFECQATSVNADAGIADCTTALESASAALAETRAALSGAEALVGRLTNDAERARAGVDQLEAGVQFLTISIRGTTEEGSEFEQRGSALEASIAAADSELATTTAAALEQDERLRGLRSDVALVDREIEIERREGERLGLLNEAAQREHTGVAAEIESTRTRMDAAVRAVSVATGEASDAGDELELARISLAEAPAEPEMSAGDGVFAELQQLHARIEQTVAAEQRNRSEIEHIDTELQKLVAECSLDLDVHPSQLDPSTDDREYSDVEIRRLRVRAEQAADVEPGAGEEYRELAARRSELDAQLTDLREAGETLESMLRDADREVRRRFRLTFARVNDLFAMFFKEIFGGGAGQLILESVDEVESVEIAAQLPGKRMRDLSGLSGGERTLVAGAFLFALLSASPPPFCVLDEVDAALDETNVDRYLGVLRQLAEETQFVVVTHNRGTMAASNTLYGIVLDANIGSRALSLQLDEAVAG